MRKIFPILVLLGACAPDIAQDPAPPPTVVVEFDLAAAVPVVPLPNDLAKVDAATGAPLPTLHVPSSPTDSDAQKEFNELYLSKLENFPYESTASALVTGDLKPETVSAMSVRVFDVTNPAAPAPVMVAPTYADKKVSIAPPAGNWLRAHKYAVAFIGGTNPVGMRGAAGQDVVGSESWALVSSSNPLITCPNNDLKSPDCAPAVDVIPSHEIDLEARFKDQTAKARQLEQLRLGYKPILDALGGLGVDRKDIPIVWTFTIVDAGEMTFDPAKKVIPFPNDAVRTGPGGTVSLPNPVTGMPLTAADCAAATDSKVRLYCGLNTLDGFSTLSPPISENSDEEGALDQGLIDAASLTAMSVGLAKLKSDAPVAIQTTPSWKPCLNCKSSTSAAGVPQTSPQQLQWSLNAPLDEKTTYFAYVTSAVKDTAGKPVIANPAFALVRLSKPLVDAAGKSTVSLISDDQAKQLEPLRAGYSPAFDGLAKAGIKREDIALAFPFTTQSESTVLSALTAVPAAAKAGGLPDYPLVLQDATALYQGAATAAGIPVTAIGKFFGGAWLTPLAVTSASGTFQPGLAGIKPQLVQFAISVPLAAPPAGGYPVTIFGHGFTRGRNDFLSIANALAAAGQVVIATDVYLHGERTTCTGSKTFTKQTTDDAACKDPATMKCDEGALQGLCVLRAGVRAACAPSATDPLGDGVCALAGQGRCAADAMCQGVGADLARDASGLPSISGLAIFNLANFFNMRDSLRQQVIDLSQLVAVLRGTEAGKSFALQLAAANLGALPLDTTKLGYVGQSLGGIQGTLFNSVSPDTTNVVLNVPGGSWTTLVKDTVSFSPIRDSLLAGLAAQGLNPGTPAFDQFFGTMQWILDPADPANMAYRLTHPVDIGGGKTSPNANRKAFIQFIQADQAVPNSATFVLLASANRSFVPTPPGFGCVAPLLCYEFTEAGDTFDATSAPLANRHGFLLKPPSATAGGLGLTTKAQTQAATFIATGALP